MTKTPTHPYKGIASELAKFGRYGDTELLHVNKVELDMLESMSPGGLTTNPHTGQKEAFLPFLIPMLSSFIPALTGLSGTSALLASSVASGLGTWGLTGDAKEGLKSGLLSFGLGGLGNAMTGAKGAAEAVSPAKLAAQKAKATVTKATVANQPASAATGLLSRAAQSPQGLGVKGIATNPIGAFRAAAAHPMSIGLPLAIGSTMALQGGKAPGVRSVDNSGPKDRPAGGYQPRPRTHTPYPGNPKEYGQSGGEHNFFSYSNPNPSTPTYPGAYQSQTVMAPDDRMIDINDIVAGGGIVPDRGLAHFYRGGIVEQPSRPVVGPGGPTDDKIPAMLSNGEYVFSAKAVKNMGDGSTERGFDVLDGMHKDARKMAAGGPVTREGIPEDLPRTDYTERGLPKPRPPHWTERRIGIDIPEALGVREGKFDPRILGDRAAYIGHAMGVAGRNIGEGINSAVRAAPAAMGRAQDIVTDYAGQSVGSRRGDSNELRALRADRKRREEELARAEDGLISSVGRGNEDLNMTLLDYQRGLLSSPLRATVERARLAQEATRREQIDETLQKNKSWIANLLGLEREDEKN